MRHSRAQAASEFLMTYGWAVLILAVIAGVLFYLGVFSAQSPVSSCVLPSGFTCAEYRMDDYGNLYLNLGQATGKMITVTGVGCGSSSNPTVWLASVSISHGGHANVTGAGIPCSDVQAGAFKGSVVITYLVAGSSLPRTVRGTVCAPVLYGNALALFGPGWNSSFAYFRPVILTTGVASNLTDFPAYFAFDSASLIAAGKMNSSCKDARVISSDNQTMDFEIEGASCNTSSTVVWTRIPQTNANQNYYVYLYYGNSSAPDAQNKAGVWRNNFLNVYHLGDLKDSVTGGAGTNVSAIANPGGRIGGAYQFDGGVTSWGGVDFGSKAGLGVSTAITVSAWANFADTGTTNGWVKTIYSWGDEGANKLVWLGYGNSGGMRYYWEVGNGTRRDSLETGDPGIGTGRWYYFAATFDSGNYSIYKNAARYSTAVMTTNPVYNGPTAYNVKIGRYSAANSHYFNGTIDEVRISGVARGPEWIAAEYGQTYVVGGEQANGG